MLKTQEEYLLASVFGFLWDQSCVWVGHGKEASLGVKRPISWRNVCAVVAVIIEVISSHGCHQDPQGEGGILSYSRQIVETLFVTLYHCFNLISMSMQYSMTGIFHTPQRKILW